jgi:hypothetical protein
LFSAYWGWLLSESRFPDLVETLAVKVIERVAGDESGALQAGALLGGAVQLSVETLRHFYPKDISLFPTPILLMPVANGCELEGAFWSF